MLGPNLADKYASAVIKYFSFESKLETLEADKRCAPVIVRFSDIGTCFTTLILKIVLLFALSWMQGLRTPNEDIKRYLKNWADVTDKICFGRYLKIGIFGSAVKAISSPGVRSP